jgi:hypothetical protein
VGTVHDGRIHLLRSEHARGADVPDIALEQISHQGWMAFQPWPAGFRAEAAIGLGHLETPGLLDHAWVLATENNDHSWMATVA